MGLKEDIEDMKNEIQKVQEESFALEILKDYKKQNKRLYIIIIVLMCFWLITIARFVYHLETTGYEEITEIADTDDGGNACVGDNCNNGVINGKGN